MNKLEAKFAQEAANIINRLAETDPSWQKLFPRLPAYRYFRIKGSEDECFWTTESVKHNGHRRFASGIYKFIKSRQAWRLTKPKYHAKRKDAKARALTLYSKAKEEHENQNT